jgi:hypothetical protein
MATQDEKNIVIKRLQSLRPTIKLSLAGENEPLTKAQMIAHVEADDKIGEMITSAYMGYLRSFKKKSD